MLYSVNEETQQQIIESIVAGLAASNQSWLRKYLEENITDIINSVFEGDALKHGFRGLEVKEELKRRGLLSL